MAFQRSSFSFRTSDFWVSVKLQGFHARRTLSPNSSASFLSVRTRFIKSASIPMFWMNSHSVPTGTPRFVFLPANSYTQNCTPTYALSPLPSASILPSTRR
ncbi:hypothetical protein PS2_008874 [Malus domestica]